MTNLTNLSPKPGMFGFRYSGFRIWESDDKAFVPKLNQWFDSCEHAIIAVDDYIDNNPDYFTNLFSWSKNEN